MIKHVCIVCVAACMVEHMIDAVHGTAMHSVYRAF
jgi:hypothetical protein